MVVVRLFVLVPDFLHRNPLPISYSSTGDFSDLEPDWFSMFRTLTKRVLHRVLYKGIERESYKEFCRYSVSILYGICKVCRGYHIQAVIYKVFNRVFQMVFSNVYIGYIGGPV